MTEQELVLAIGRMAEAIELESDGRVAFPPDGRRALGRPEGASTDDERNDLVARLTSFFYESFYCRPGQVTDLVGSAHEPGTPAFAAERDAFVERLKAANRTTDRWDLGWTVQDLGRSGRLTAHKGDDARPLRVGEFVAEEYSFQPLSPGNSVRLRVFRESVPAASGFYFAFGESPEPQHRNFTARIYFNLVSAGAPVIVERTTSMFNRYGIPFQLKCLAHPRFYSRADAAVLYVQKSHVELIYQLVLERFEDLCGHLREEHPLFTLPLAPGVAFAENPSSGESFGVNRCRAIAAGFSNAILSGAPRDTWTDAIRASLTARGLDVARIHRNPGSAYPYSFEARAGAP